MHTISKFGAAVLIVGAVILVGPTFGFSSIAADRGVGVSVSQENGLVGLEPRENIQEINRGNSRVVGEIGNNVDGTMELTVSVEQAPLQITNEDELATLESGQTRDVEVACDGQGKGDGPITIIVDIAVVSSGVTIEQASMDVPVSYNCGGPPGGGDPPDSGDQFEVQTVGTGESDSIAVFELTNTGAAQEVHRVSLDGTTVGATHVENQNSVEFRIDDESGTEIGSAEPQGNQQWNIDGSRKKIDQEPTIDADETVTITVGEFWDNDGSVDLEGGTIELTLYRQGNNAIQSISVSVPVQASGDGDVESDGDVIVEDSDEVSGDMSAGGDVSTGWESEVDGNIDANGDVSTGDSSEVDGDVAAGDDASTGWDSEVDGNLEAGNDVSVGSESEIGGNVVAGGNVETGWDSTIDGSVNAGGDVSTGDSSEIDGDISAEGDVIIGNSSDVDGDIIADGNVYINESAQVDGDITAGGNVFVGWNAEISGSVDSDGDVSVNGGAIDGSMTAGGNIELEWGTEVGGDVHGDGDVTIDSGAEIDGTVSTGGELDDQR
ncbi:polymer-forming cytoskeletal protein [Halobacteria archaeon AArc-m2/3/4]|uniref:Polymer-forming cytoskeletal protein n=1 Tax=Natronoglomus mannanivorans TaxID=2979990 RepID=A0ABT2QHH7_9EURY|nr:polymer-forming cytoskeletal protein [Halobacteria archaeon AArc-m2/3/4]